MNTDKDSSAEALSFSYRFLFKNGEEKRFSIFVDPNTLDNIKPEGVEYPEWTLMKNFKCPHCPLSEEVHQYCPVAINLVDVIKFFSDALSYEQVEIMIETTARNYFKKTSLQDGVSAMIGVLMVTSGCPVMGKLKPMVRFHLPFATLEETEYRVLSMYLLAQFFLWKKGNEPDWEMKNLVNIYEDIKILNLNVCKQIADLESKDTSINSVVVLNNFADYVSFSVDQKMLDEVEVLFKDYLN